MIKKIIMFFSGLAILILTFGMLYFTGAIFDAGTNLTVQPYFFQPNFLSERRPGTPLTVEEIGDTKFLDMLIKKYVTEYFYVIPDVENVARRTLSSSSLAKMSSSAAFKTWLDTEAKNIQELAEAKKMRTVDIIGEIYKPSGSDYYVINYELKTWTKPNDFNTIPSTNRGILYLNINFESGMRTDVSMTQIHEYLEAGYDPVSVFKFQVIEVIQG